MLFRVSLPTPSPFKIFAMVELPKPHFHKRTEMLGTHTHTLLAGAS